MIKFLPYDGLARSVIMMLVPDVRGTGGGYARIYMYLMLGFWMRRRNRISCVISVSSLLWALTITVAVILICVSNALIRRRRNDGDFLEFCYFWVGNQ